MHMTSTMTNGLSVRADDVEEVGDDERGEESVVKRTPRRRRQRRHLMTAGVWTPLPTASKVVEHSVNNADPKWGVEAISEGDL